MSAYTDDCHDDGYEPTEDWTPGTCDQCGMKDTPPGWIGPVCACSIGEGSVSYECTCT
ncbi:hypothetical protein [Actinoplanes sp. GCM10030250]|uniref:hypothetical protein n=1 Tax=Actinoplanes sp. GCM10030250 TaxID=3273376 RepID=UPI003611651C